MLLRLRGHEVRIASDGTSALEIAKFFRPEMIFLDIGMPGLNGYETARLIRAESWGLPLDFQSALADDGFSRSWDERGRHRIRTARIPETPLPVIVSTG
jgi:CheY-like chemotaxis protein